MISENVIKVQINESVKLVEHYKCSFIFPLIGWSIEQKLLPDRESNPGRLGESQES